MATRNASSLFQGKYFLPQLKRNYKTHRPLGCYSEPTHGRPAVVQTVMERDNLSLQNNGEEFHTSTRGIHTSTSIFKQMSQNRIESLFHSRHQQHRTFFLSTPHVNDQPLPQITDQKPGTKFNNVNICSEMLIENLHKCSSVDEVLSHASLAMQLDSLPESCISVVFSTLQRHAYATIIYPKPQAEDHMKRSYLEWNFLADKALGPCLSDSRFQDLLSYVESNISKIPISDCISILRSLDWLFLIKPDSGLVSKIFDKCSENLDSLDLEQLAGFSLICKSFTDNVFIHGKFANALKTWLSTHLPHEIDIESLCSVSENIACIVSNDLPKVVTRAIVSRLLHDPSNITIALLNRISLLYNLPTAECYTILVSKLKDLPPQYITFDVTNDNITYDTALVVKAGDLILPGPGTWKHHCFLELCKDTLPLEDFVKLYYIQKNIPDLVLEKRLSMLAQFVEDSDNFLLFKFQLSFIGGKFYKLPGYERLMIAYISRIKKLLTTLNEHQLDELLVSNRGKYGLILLRFFFKFFQPERQHTNEALLALHRYLKLKPDLLDNPPNKIKLATYYTCEALMHGFMRSPAAISSLANNMQKLDPIFIMQMHRKLELFSTNKHLAPAAMQQILYLKKTLQQIFEDKISRESTRLDAYASSKIVPPSSYYRYLEYDRRDLYGQLLKHLPRFLKDADDKNYIDVLIILKVGAEMFSPYQKNLFENLTTFIVSNPSKFRLTSSTNLLKALAYSGYQLDAHEGFESWISKLETHVIEAKHRHYSRMVRVAYHLALLGIFRDDLLLNVFSLDFMMGLDQELYEIVDQSAKIKHDLAVLNRSVVIECPHLGVSWFGRSLLHSVDKSESLHLGDVVFRSLSRLAGDDSYIQRPAESPYAHHIHLLMHFDSRSGLVKHEDIKKTQPVPDIEKIAIMVLMQYHYCYNTDILTGRMQTDIRQLQILGYKVVLLNYKEISALKVDGAEKVDDHVQAKVNAAVGCDVFSQFDYLKF